MSHGDQLLFEFLASEMASEMYCDEIVDGDGRLQYLDSVVSVSALVDEDEGGLCQESDVAPRDEVPSTLRKD